MLATGVTACLPTLITASDDARSPLLRPGRAVSGSRLGPLMVPGYHLEGPFLNPGDGYAGCHPPEAMTAARRIPDRAAEPALVRPILLVTIAPETRRQRSLHPRHDGRGRVVAIGHSAAGFASGRSRRRSRGMSLDTSRQWLAAACRRSSTTRFSRSWRKTGYRRASSPMAFICRRTLLKPCSGQGVRARRSSSAMRYRPPPPPPGSTLSPGRRSSTRRMGPCACPAARISPVRRCPRSGGSQPRRLGSRHGRRSLAYGVRQSAPPDGGGDCGSGRRSAGQRSSLVGRSVPSRCQGRRHRAALRAKEELSRPWCLISFSVAAASSIRRNPSTG